MLTTFAVFACLAAPHQCDDSYLVLSTCENGHTCTHLVPYEPQEGDIIFCQNNNNLQTFIWALACAGPPTHNGIVVMGPDGKLGMLEAPGVRHRVVISPLPYRIQTYDGKVWVRRAKRPLTPEEAAALREWAWCQLGKPFATKSMLLLPLGPPHQGPVMSLFGPAHTERDRWFCSQLVAAAGVVMGWIDPCSIRPTFTDPKDMFTDRLIDLSCFWEKPVRWKCYGCYRKTSEPPSSCP